MTPMEKTFAQEVFINATEEQQQGKFAGFKVFAERRGWGWSVLRLLVSILFILSYLVHSIIFLSFFISTLAFSISLSLDMTFELLSPVASTQSQKNVIAVCLFLLLCCLIIVVSFLISLFWEVLKAVLFNITIKFNIARVVFLLLVVVASGVWAGAAAQTNTRIYFADYFLYISVVVWISAFGLSILGSLVQILFVYTQSFDNKKRLYVHLGIGVVFVVSSFICSISFGIITESSAGVIAFVLLLPLFTAILVVYTYFRGKVRDRKSYIFKKYPCLTYLILFLLTITIFTATMNAPTGCDGQCKEELMKNALTIDGLPFPSTHYQICGQTWTSKLINIAEMAFFANLAYSRQIIQNNSTAVQQVTNYFFRRRNMTWTVKHISSSRPYFIHLRTENVHIISIRGSKDTLEFVESAKIWDETAVLQSLSMVFPVLQNLPQKFKAEYVSKSSFLNKIIHAGSNSHFFQVIEDYVQEVKNRSSSDVVLVGHSLGGGIAKIIGARHQIPAISFSSPGIGYSYIKYGFSLENAMKFAVTIVPDGDIIPQVDKLCGQVQNIRCTGENFVQCHLMSRTYCELQFGCGILMPGCEYVIEN